MDVPTFMAAYPAFRETDEIHIQATLNRAARMVDATVWGAQQDDGIGLLTAHWLWTDPMGATTAVQGAETKSVYGEQFAALKSAIVGGGFGVASGAGPSGGPGGTGWPWGGGP